MSLERALMCDKKKQFYDGVKRAYGGVMYTLESHTDTAHTGSLILGYAHTGTIVLWKKSHIIFS